MLDLETLGTAEDAAILEIGMVAFELPAAGLPAGLMGPEFFQLVRVESNAAAGRKCSAETVAWWIRKWREGMAIPDPDSGGSVGDAVVAAAEFIRGHLCEGGKLWSKGHFDAPILGHSLLRLGLPVPWKFWQVADVRSVMFWEGLWDNVASRMETAHSALEDARAQTEVLLALGRQRRWRWDETQDCKTQDARLEPAWCGTQSVREADLVCGGKGGVA